jgi:hypothetical protein
MQQRWIDPLSFNQVALIVTPWIGSSHRIDRTSQELNTSTTVLPARSALVQNHLPCVWMNRLHGVKVRDRTQRPTSRHNTRSTLVGHQQTM